MSNDRYKYSKIINNTLGKRVFSSVIFPKIPTSSTDIIIIATDTDRLDWLAYKWYGDSTMWWIIAQANKIRGTFYAEPGKQLVIPMDLAAIEAALQEANK